MSAGLWIEQRHADSINPLHGLLNEIVAIRALDERTVEIELSRPVADLVTTLAWGNLVIMNARTAARAKTSPVGTGPFRFAQWRKGDSVVLERNPNYWGPPARIDQVTFRIIPDATSALASSIGRRY
jgi:peptide/nickel transport system substrate-binding protein